MKEILIFINIICCLLLCSCEQIEYTDHPNLYHTGRYFDVVKLNDSTFLCMPNVSGKDVITIKISNHEIYERKD